MWPVFAGGMLAIVMVSAHNATETNQHLTQQNQHLHSQVKQLKKHQIQPKNKIDGVEIKNLDQDKREE